jgi:hypothetical protein
MMYEANAFRLSEACLVLPSAIHTKIPACLQ